MGNLKKLIVGRSGLLYIFPFELLQLENGELLEDKYSFCYMTGMGNACYLQMSNISNISICYEDLLQLKQEKEDIAVGPPLVIADPDYDLGQVPPGSIPRGKVLVSTARYWLFNVITIDQSESYKRLPGANKEGIELADLLKVSPKMQNEATKSVLKDLQVPPLLIHFASHAHFSQMTNVIVLAGMQ